MSDLLKSIDARTRLAGNNKLEILLFSLGVDQRTGRNETFGINVFKVREVMRAPQITAAPDMPESVQGMVSLRGSLVPVVDLARFAGIVDDNPREIMIVTEYNGHTQGFLVGKVETILRLDWSLMRVPPAMLAARMGGLVTAVTELEGNRLVMMIDVERVLSEITRYDDEQMFQGIESIGLENARVLFADDSVVARRQIEKTLTMMGVKATAANNGKQAWEELEKLATYAAATDRTVRQLVQVVLTDVEMPELDGFMLTKRIKSDPRFADIPVIMHSSLSGSSNQHLGKSVGVDAYVSKFEPQRLSAMLGELLRDSLAAQQMQAA